MNSHTDESNASEARTFVIGDVHGEIGMLRTVMARLPTLTEQDTLVFLGDYIDRGPKSKAVLDAVRRLPQELKCRVVALRGNHEDAWLRVIDNGWPEFLLPRGNGALATYRSWVGTELSDKTGLPSAEEFAGMERGGFFSAEQIAWMRELPYWYEDAHGIYVHAGLLARNGAYMHPKDCEPKAALLWTRTREFFTDYRGKHVVVGHTRTKTLPQELSQFTPEDPTDMWAGPCVTAIDTGAGSEGGFLTALELPAMRVYESR
ncbi:MAG: metallophosphoesterase [Deltaproteobacteria bacterium]|nr:metallophosphoesterase [Deltaproteobacteria bacterium]